MPLIGSSRRRDLDQRRGRTTAVLRPTLGEQREHVGQERVRVGVGDEQVDLRPVVVLHPGPEVADGRGAGRLAVAGIGVSPQNVCRTVGPSRVAPITAMSRSA